MDKPVKQIMNRAVHTIAPQVALPDLEREFVRRGVTAFPVVDKGHLVGIVSRSDVIRQLYLEHLAADIVSDFYFDRDGIHEVPLVSFEQVAGRVGERIERLTVEEVMSRSLICVAPDQPLRQVAEIMVDRGVHRVLVTEGKRLIGVVSAMDLVRLMANGKLRAAG